MTTTRRAILAVPLMLLAEVEPLRAGPLGTTFTYQGKLKQKGLPFTGNANIEFRLFDTPVAPDNLIGAQTVNAVAVADGLFTAQLNDAGQFGANAFTGDARWLEVVVNGTTLAPRQPLTATPYALRALSAPGSGLWQASGNNIFNSNSGGVGVGTSTPAHKLDVVGDALISARIAAGNNANVGVNGSYDNIFDFSHRISDFSAAPNMQGLRSFISLDPSVDLTGANARPIYGFDLEAVIPAGNSRNFHYLNGAYLGALHFGTGTVETLQGGLQIAHNRGTVRDRLGALAISEVAGAGSTTNNYALAVVCGHWGTAGSIDNNYGIYVLTPFHDRPLTNHYGIYLEDQDVGVNDSFAIYSAGGKSYFAGDVGIGTTSPQAALDVNGTIAISPATRYYSIHGHGFQPFTHGIEYYKGSAALAGVTPGETVQFLAPVSLPHGAIVTGFEAHLWDADPDPPRMVVDLRRTASNETVATMASVSSVYNASSSQTRVDDTIANPIVDNDQYSYVVMASWTTPSPDFYAQRLIHVRIRYTVAAPLP